MVLDDDGVPVPAWGGPQLGVSRTQDALMASSDRICMDLASGPATSNNWAVPTRSALAGRHVEPDRELPALLAYRRAGRQHGAARLGVVEEPVLERTSAG